MPHWEHQLRTLDGFEADVLCYLDDSDNTIGEITQTIFSEQPDPRQIVVRQATRKKPPRIAESGVLAIINNTAQQLNLGNVLGSTFNGCVFPRGSSTISTGNYLSEEDAMRSVEVWWNYWLKDMH